MLAAAHAYEPLRGDDEAARGLRFRNMMLWLVVAAIGAVSVEAMLVLHLGRIQDWVYLIIGSTFIVMAPWLARIAQQGRTQTAALVIAGFMFAAPPVLAASFQRAELVPLILPGIGIVIALSFVEPRLLARTFLGAWMSVMGTMAILQGKGAALPTMTSMAGLVAFFVTGIALGVLLVVFWFHYNSLQRNLAIVSEANERLVSAQLEFQKVQQTRNRFMNNAAHELNTPMTPIVMQIDVLKRRSRDNPDGRTLRSIFVLERSVARLRHLINDVLEAARMNSFNLTIEKAPVDLALLVDDALEDFAGPFTEKRISLDRHIDPELMVIGDLIRLRQVIDNFLTNALKFTPEGGSVVMSATGAEHEASVAVRDSGHGISQDNLDSLFEPFSRLARAEHEDVGGSGLGLYISKGIIEQHGGRVWVRSAGEGLGTTFGFHLPLIPMGRPEHEEAGRDDASQSQDEYSRARMAGNLQPTP